MADRSKIEWTDASWNPIRARNRATGKAGWHCEHASPGCAHCYAETFNARLGTRLPFKPGHRADVEIFVDETMLLQPLRWRRPRIIFVGSMTDLFGAFVPDEVIDLVFAVMALCPQHIFQVLTKRSGRMRAYLSAARAHPVGMAAFGIVLNDHARNPRSDVGAGVKLQGDIPHLQTWPLPNVWAGVSAEDQPRAEERVLDLLVTPAAVRFVSAEPLLGPIDFRRLAIAQNVSLDALTGQFSATGGFSGGLANFQAGLDASPPLPERRPHLDQIIVGGESGPRARPLHPQWVRDIRDPCAATGVAFFFKQWGEYAPCDLHPPGTAALSVVGSCGRHLIGSQAIWGDPDDKDAEIVGRFGKKRSGRLLDGIEHNGMPRPFSSSRSERVLIDA